MPEEINRLVADRLSELLFCISPSGVENLAAEGIIAGVHYVGDVMYDAVLHTLPFAIRRTAVLSHLGVSRQGYVLATVHRAANTDDPETLMSIASALNALDEPVVFPVHPRAREAIGKLGVSFRAHVKAIEPVGYLDMLMLETCARVILTDSGGVTREAYFLGVPCVTLRLQTEHVETIELGWNTLVGTESDHIIETVKHFRPSGPHPPIYGDGNAAQRIVRTLEDTP
jgi:UDP-GlcNAc3NAcA epimerase